MKKVAIVQSCYIPWKGYFDLIAQVDEFILLDDVQFTRRDWRNRNKIKTSEGVKWLSIPVASKGRFESPIDEIEVSNRNWPKKHLAALRHSYSKAQCYRDVASWVEDLYSRVDSPMLSEINRYFIESVCEFLGIATKISWSSDYGRSDKSKTERLLELCQACGCTHYLSGPSARAYLEEEKFSEVGLAVNFADYEGYQKYPQVHPPFTHTVSILDLIFSTGKNATEFLRFG